MRLRGGGRVHGRASSLARSLAIRGATCLRVALLPPGASGGEVPAGAHGDLQAGGAAVVGQAELQLSGHAVEEAKLGAGAAVAALRRSLGGNEAAFRGD